jgi:hypothetical protein
MNNNSERKQRLYRDQLVTVDDLDQFKTELLESFKTLLKGNGIAPAKKWLKSLEVRKLLGISAGKLLTLRVNGSLPYTKIGGVIYYDQEDIQKMFESKKFSHA